MYINELSGTLGSLQSKDSHGVSVILCEYNNSNQSIRKENETAQLWMFQTEAFQQGDFGGTKCRVGL